MLFGNGCYPVKGIDRCHRRRIPITGKVASQMEGNIRTKSCQPAGFMVYLVFIVVFPGMIKVVTSTWLTAAAAVIVFNTGCREAPHWER